jgi:hypothetical protein
MSGQAGHWNGDAPALWTRHGFIRQSLYCQRL